MMELWHCSLCAADAPRDEFDLANRCADCQRRSLILADRLAARRARTIDNSNQKADN